MKTSVFIRRCSRRIARARTRFFPPRQVRVVSRVRERRFVGSSAEVLDALRQHGPVRDGHIGVDLARVANRDRYAEAAQASFHRSRRRR
jgi:hypothetical protein